jgi:transcriptional/translational regulatory protein YebC/TACO1
MDAGAEDFSAEEECFEIYTDPDSFGQVYAKRRQRDMFSLCPGRNGPPELRQADLEEDIRNMEKLIDMPRTTTMCRRIPQTGSRI